MANNEFIDGTLTVGGVLTATGGVSATTNSFGTSTSASGAVTLNSRNGTITTETLTTTGQTVYTLTITNNTVTVGDVIMASIDNGTNTTGIPVVTNTHAAAGVITIKVANAATTATNALGGSLLISFVTFKK